MHLDLHKKHNHITYWQDVSSQLEGICHRNGHHVLDIYLVGSQVNGYKENSDFDSVVVLDNTASLSEQKSLHHTLQDHITTHANRYHFKIFSLNGLHECCHYDGFRIASFQHSNISLYSSGCLDKLRPILDAKCFANSILIQCVYGYFCNEFPLKGMEYLNTRIQKWKHINNGLLTETPTNEPIKFEYLLSHNKLLYCFYKALENQSINQNFCFTTFLENYFVEIPHEWVNKSRTYLDKIRSRSTST